MFIRNCTLPILLNSYKLHIRHYKSICLNRNSGLKVLRLLDSVLLREQRKQHSFFSKRKQHYKQSHSVFRLVLWWPWIVCSLMLRGIIDHFNHIQSTRHKVHFNQIESKVYKEHFNHIQIRELGSPITYRVGDIRITSIT